MARCGPPFLMHTRDPAALTLNVSVQMWAGFIRVARDRRLASNCVIRSIGLVCTSVKLVTSASISTRSPRNTTNLKSGSNIRKCRGFLWHFPQWLRVDRS